ncbi:hypothetical protein SAMN04487857_10397 [Pseudomonas sp. ok272]|nr:hypothetical protein SAMN04487857_10397 [Pseudomonas sp. ok272]SFM51191.1 hypothetical protein SAMN04487858_103339 [Pseudomonas sp. ok602]
MEPKLREFPHSFPISPDASALGVLGYQQLLIAPYRIVFEIVEDRKEVAVYLVLRQNQSLEPALIRYCLVAPIL